MDEKKESVIAIREREEEEESATCERVLHFSDARYSREGGALSNRNRFARTSPVSSMAINRIISCVRIAERNYNLKSEVIDLRTGSYKRMNFPRPISNGAIETR